MALDTCPENTETGGPFILHVEQCQSSQGRDSNLTLHTHLRTSYYHQQKSSTLPFSLESKAFYLRPGKNWENNLSKFRLQILFLERGTQQQIYRMGCFREATWLHSHTRWLSGCWCFLCMRTKQAFNIHSPNFHIVNTLPLTDRCLHVTVGSGLPIARHNRVTLLPSFTVMSEEMFIIWGGTIKKKKREKNHWEWFLALKELSAYKYSFIMLYVCTMNIILIPLCSSWQRSGLWHHLQKKYNRKIHCTLLR